MATIRASGGVGRRRALCWRTWLRAGRRIGDPWIVRRPREYRQWVWRQSTAVGSVSESDCQMRAGAGGLIDDDPGVRSLITLGVLVTALTLAAGAWGRPLRRSGRSSRSVTLDWVGDMAMSTERGLPPGGLERALAPVARDLRAAEVTLGNLEGTLSTGGVSKCASLPRGVCFAFQAPPSYAFALHNLGFDLVNQANNHSMDFGASGRAQTVAALDRAGIGHTGFPGEITYLRANGIRVAFLGFAPYAFDANLLDIAGARALVRRARQHAAIVVVIIHAGAEGADQLHTPYGTQFYLGENRGDARGFAHAVIDAGASIVLGSGPHVIRGVERYRGRLIAYSLGNFVGYHTLAGGGVLDDSAILRATLDPRGRVLAARWIPITLVDGLPRPDRTGASTNLVMTLSAQDFPTDHWKLRSDGVFRIPATTRR
jgi:Bacterial capsule synthesis protein PGA_cap